MVTESNAADHPFKTCLLNKLPTESYVFFGPKLLPSTDPVGQERPQSWKYILMWCQHLITNKSSNKQPSEYLYNSLSNCMFLLHAALTRSHTATATSIFG